MTKQLTLNCDMGEGFGPWEMGDDKAIMPLIDAANIAEFIAPRIFSHTDL